MGIGNLPGGWIMTTLGQIRQEERKTVNPAKNPEQVFELYSVPIFETGRPEIVLGKEIGSNKQIVEKDTVLVCKINPRINRVWVVRNFSNHPKIASTEWVQFKKVDGILPNYLCYYMQTSAFRDNLAQNVSGVGGSLMRARTTAFEDYPLPIPPLPEQERIVAKIEELFTQLEAGTAALKRVQAGLKRYKASVLKAAVEGRLSNVGAHGVRPLSEESSPAQAGRTPSARTEGELPDGWRWTTVGEIGTTNEQTVLTGPFGSNLGSDDFIVSGIPVLTIGCLTEQGINLGKAKYISKEKAAELARYTVREGDLLFSRMATVGRAGLVTKEHEGAIFNYHIMRLRLAENVIDPDFFLAYVRGSSTVNHYVKEVNHGATRDGINTEQLLAMPVVLPPLAEQRRIVAEVERRLEGAQEVESVVAASVARAGRLRQSVLKSAFEGRLTP